MTFSGSDKRRWDLLSFLSDCAVFAQSLLTEGKGNKQLHFPALPRQAAPAN